MQRSVEARGSTEAGVGVKAGTTRVLDEDLDLREVVEARAERAAEASVANVLRVQTGNWRAAWDGGAARVGFGLLMLDGVIVRRVGVDARYGAELLANGDLLRPWEHDASIGVLPFETAWQVVETTRLAILD